MPHDGLADARRPHETDLERSPFEESREAAERDDERRNEPERFDAYQEDMEGPQDPFQVGRAVGRRLDPQALG